MRGGVASESGRHTVVVLAENRDGVLSRITSLLDARAHDIESIAVGQALDPSLMRIVLVVRGDEGDIERMTKQLRNLIEVLKVTDLTEVEHIQREMLLLRVTARGEESRAKIVRIADSFRAKILDQTPDSYVLEMTGEDSTITSLLDLLEPFGVREVVRTGKIAIARAVGTRQGATRGPTGREHLRHPVGFEVRIDSLESTAPVHAHDISAGGMSVKTKSEVAIGTTLTMAIVHPVTGRQIPLRAIVRRKITRPDFRGIGVEFVDLDEANRRSIDEFMSSETGDPE